ncbi:biopolymer transporter ExbD [Marivirga sp.]|uniref:ExbD/TolR family protein n=1 Tax=Marivirga sp. TaxID=2018662 RepID=UPI002D7F6543|nr:biopolymer transporter ExbD [Marivirga sp.]HET8859642.1 biopolymer transporter ExbD [Marivirga sp.]
MSLKSRNQVDPAFSMSSMTDIIFLLLIFFMLTSSFITPSGLPVNLPSSKSTSIVMQKVSVTITKDMLYFVNDKRVAVSDLETAIKRELRNADEGVVVLHIDKSVPTEHLVKVAGIAASLKAKVSIAAQPNE